MRRVTCGSPLLSKNMMEQDSTSPENFGRKKDLGAGSNWRKEYFRASSNSIMEACTQCTVEIFVIKSNHLVPTAVAVVGRGEDGDDISVVGPVVTFHHQLMCPENHGMRFGSKHNIGNILS